MVTLTNLSHTEMSREKSLNAQKRHLQAFAGKINETLFYNIYPLV